MESFEKPEVSIRGSRLCVKLYQELKGRWEWGFRDQITRSALSVPSNIAKGYERNSRKEYLQDLRIAKGPCGELRTQLFVGAEAGLIEIGRAGVWADEAKQIGKMLGAIVSRLSREAAL
jgi:four helix bundle protein